MIKKYLEYNNPSEKVQKWINTTLQAYLKKNPENVVEVEHILDYLASPKAPNRLTFMSYAQAKSNSDKWNKTLIKKGAHIKEVEADVKVIKEFKNGFTFVELRGEAAFKREGHLMRHCAGGYFGKDDTKVYSLRDPMNMPHATIEVVGENNVQQIKGKGNGKIHPDYIKMVLDVLKYFKLPVREQELQNLGYVKFMSKPALDFLKTVYAKDSFLKLRGEEYFYEHATRKS